MSYILDALKRADSERERGLVPGLHAQPVPLDTPAQGAHGAVKPVMLLLAGAGLVVLCVMLWRWLGPAPVSTTAAAPQIVATAPPVAPVAVRPAPENPALPQTFAPPTATAAPEPVQKPGPSPVQAPRMVMAPAQITPATSSTPSSAVEREPDRTEPETRSSRPPALAPPARPANPAPIAATPAAVTRVTPLAELPADIRLAMPKLVISGATYADNPAYRMLIINGQVFHEGEKPGTDLLLEQIGPKSAVLNFKGQRYSLGY